MKSKSPYVSQLALFKDRDHEKVMEVEDRQKGAVSISALKKQPLSARVIKSIYGNDGTYIDNILVDCRLVEWRQSYLKQRAKPKKYEDMLYFLDLYNGK